MVRGRILATPLHLLMKQEGQSKDGDNDPKYEKWCYGGRDGSPRERTGAHACESTKLGCEMAARALQCGLARQLTDGQWKLMKGIEPTGHDTGKLKDLN